MDVKARVREYMSEFIGGKDLADGDDFFARGLVNSLFAMQLVLFVEKAFGISVAGGDMDLDNFRSLDAIDAFVRRKRG